MHCGRCRPPVICVYPRSSPTNLTKTTQHSGAADSYEGPVLALGGAEELRLPLPGAQPLGEVGARSAPREGRTNHGGGRSWQDRGARRWARLRAPNPPVRSSSSLSATEAARLRARALFGVGVRPFFD